MSPGALVEGTEAHPAVVSDAGPLIHVDELALLDPLLDFAYVLVPQTVWSEVSKHRPRALELAAATCAGSQPKPPSEIVADVPKDLEKLILRCLRKGPEKRWSSDGRQIAFVRFAIPDLAARR